MRFEDYKTFRTAVGGRLLQVEVGKVAGMANGAATVRYGDTVVNVTQSTQLCLEQNLLASAVSLVKILTDIADIGLRLRREDVRCRKDSGRFYQERRPSDVESDSLLPSDRPPHPSSLPEGIL